MDVDGALLQVPAVGAAGLVLSVVIERFLLPSPRLLRSPQIWGIHVGLWCAAYSFLLVLMGRPWCAMAATSAVLATLVLVSNAKRKNLREPFLFQDYDYFLDALRFPRLFLPFLGLKSFCLAAAFFALALIGVWTETPPSSRFAPRGQLGGIAVLLLCAVMPLGWTKRHPPAISLDPEKDIQNMGLLPSLWLYGMASRTLPEARSPFERMGTAVRRSRPHLVAVQSESFFDARTLFAGIRPDVLCAFDSLRAASDMHGSLSVPAWGANTVRTEFSFLTGIPARHMGVHRFNPYQTIARGWPVNALPLFLKKLGYRTICIHPYWARFYGRDRVLRQLGFETFLDISAFDGARRAGSYVSDEEVGKRILHVLREAASPVFIFAVTMENHGPLHLDPLRLEETEYFYTVPPPEGCAELGTYLLHLRNADNMLHMLHTALKQAAFPVSLCFYGDHVPIMSTVYKTFRTPSGAVPYFCWSNLPARDMAAHDAKTQLPATGTCRPECPLGAHDLASAWLQSKNML